MNTIVKSFAIIWLSLTCLNTMVWARTSANVAAHAPVQAAAAPIPAPGGCPTIRPNCNSAPDIGPSSVGTASALVCGIFLITQRRQKR